MINYSKRRRGIANTRITSTPFDDVFRTLLNDCSALILPLINEVSGEHYTEKEKITSSPNEHLLNRQGVNEEERITDTSFRIEELDGKESKKYHLECQKGIAQGLKQGDNKLSQLIAKLGESGRSQDICKAIQDKGLRKQLFAEYHII